MKNQFAPNRRGMLKTLGAAAATTFWANDQLEAWQGRVNTSNESAGGYVFERWGAPALWGCVAMVGLAAAAILASIRGPIAQPASLPENAPAVSASLPAA